MLAASWRLSSDAQRLADEYSLQLRELLPMKGVPVSGITDVALCSVVPPLTRGVRAGRARTVLRRAARRGFRGRGRGWRIRYDSPPGRRGPDRIVGRRRRPPLLRRAGHHRRPRHRHGLRRGHRTRRLPRRGDLGGDGTGPGRPWLPTRPCSGASIWATPREAIGRNTAASIRSGLVLGFTGLVETMVRRFRGGDGRAERHGRGGPGDWCP